MVGTSPNASRPAPLPALQPSHHEHRARTPKKVSRNRPDATNLNHQNANRRIFMTLSCNAIVALQIAPNAASKCELLHIVTGEPTDLRHTLVMAESAAVLCSHSLVS